jgi:hypothetical protein
VNSLPPNWREFFVSENNLINPEIVVTVGQLRKRIADLPDNMVVVLSRDGEGNSYSPASGWNEAYHYLPESNRFGVLRDPEGCWQYSDEEEPDSDEEEPVDCAHVDCEYARGVPAFVLWPS